MFRLHLVLLFQTHENYHLSWVVKYGYGQKQKKLLFIE